MVPANSDHRLESWLTFQFIMNMPTKPPRPTEVSAIAVLYVIAAIAGSISFISSITSIQADFPNEPITFDPGFFAIGILPILFCVLLALGLWQLLPLARGAAVVANAGLIGLVLLGWVTRGVHIETMSIFGWAALTIVILETAHVRHAFGESLHQSS
jgi:hypothetical protein